MYPNFLFLALLCSLLSSGLSAQSAERLIVVNGGVFGSSTSKANVGFYDLGNQQYSTADSIGVTAVQDMLITADGSFYVAANDSILYYDRNGQRLAAVAFPGVATVRLKLHDDQLLVGNFFGAVNNNFYIYDATDLSLLTGINDITKAAKDFVVWNDTAYIAQNEQTSSFTDTAGYFALVDLTTNSFVRNEMIANNGADLGRLTVIEDTLYAVNSASNSLTRYAPATGWTQTQAGQIDFALGSSGPWEHRYNGEWFMPFGGTDSIGSYDIRRNQIQRAPFIETSGSVRLAVDSLSGDIYVTTIDFVNQSNNSGSIYDNQGNLIDNYPVGDSPELLALQYAMPVSAHFVQAPQWQVAVFPNPCVEQLQLELPKDLEVRLIDNQGRLLQNWQLPEGDHQIQVAALPAGLYHLLLSDGQQQQSKSFVKQ